MEIGIGLPSTIPGAPGALLLDWAREAERRGFSSLATIDRLVYPCYDPLTALTAAAAVTDRIRLTTAITLPLLHGSAAAFAKQAASMDALSGGRLVLGLAAGARQDDFDLAGVDFHRRGQILDAALEQMTDLWSAEPPVPTGPALRPGGPPLLVGGTAKAAIRRTVTYGAGWIMGGGSPDQFRAFAGTVRSAWTEAGRSGSPRLVALAYFGLGPDARNGAESYLGDYYAFLGMPPEALAGMAALGDEAVRGVVDGFRAEGCDELLLFPCVPELGQVEHLARVTGLS